MADEKEPSKRKSFVPMFEWGDEVYLKTYPDKHVVIGYLISPNGVMYHLASGVDQSFHYYPELQLEPPNLPYLGDE